MFECFHCLRRTVVWDCDYNFEDFGYEGDGIVQILHCANCGAEIEYRIPLDAQEETEEPAENDREYDRTVNEDVVDR